MAAVFFRSTHSVSSRTSGCSLKEPIQSSQFRLPLLKRLFGLAHDTLRPFRHIKFLSPLRFLSLFLHAPPGFEKSGLLIKSIPV